MSIMDRECPCCGRMISPDTYHQCPERTEAERKARFIQVLETHVVEKMETVIRITAMGVAGKAEFIITPEAAESLVVGSELRISIEAK